MSKAEKLKVLITIGMAVIALYVVNYIYNIPLAPPKPHEEMGVSVPVVTITNESGPNISVNNEQE
jgi:hypothetical protein